MFTLARIAILADWIFSFVEGVIGLRILLKFFGANPAAPFVLWVYQTSKPLLAPFEGIFPSAVTQGGFVLEISALFALLVYGFLAYVVAEGLSDLARTRHEKIK